MDIIYILSPVRSGSTFLQFLLSSHPQIVGIGEVSHVLREYCASDVRESQVNGGYCSCGEKRASCLFWGPILADLCGLSTAAAFKRVLKHFEQLFADKVMIDSSKSGVFLEDYYLTPMHLGNDPKPRLKILYLVRDFRGWVTSIKKHRSKAGKSRFADSSIIINSYRWLYTSAKWLYRINKHDVPILPVYYEHLVFDTENQLRRIYDFLGLTNSTTVTLSHNNTHELYGSPTIRIDPRRRSSVVYDAEWMKEWKFLFLGPILILPFLFSSAYAKRTSCVFAQGKKEFERK